MSAVAIPANIAHYIFLLYFFVLWGRFVLDLARNFSRDWRPTGIGLVLSEFVFSLTDPPIRLVRRFVPSIRIGGAAIDFAWSIVMLFVVILIYLNSLLR